MVHLNDLVLNSYRILHVAAGPETTRFNSELIFLQVDQFVIFTNVEIALVKVGTDRNSGVICPK